MKPNTASLGALAAVAIVAVGCGSTPASAPPQRVVTTTTTYDDGYGYKRRPNERVYEAKVTQVRAIVGPSEQRCWVERESASTSKAPSVGGAIAGAVVGGILGHQVGSGRGQDIATAGGAIAGGAIGARAGQKYADRDVKRCETVASDTAE